MSSSSIETRGSSQRDPLSPPLNWPLVAFASLVALALLAIMGTVSWALIHSTVKTPKHVPDLAVQVPAQPHLALPPEVLPEPPLVVSESLPVLPEPVPEPPAPVALPPENCDLAPPARETYGTSVQFLGSQAEAAKEAARDQKLLFVLHISGNFEDSRFT